MMERQGKPGAAGRGKGVKCFLILLVLENMLFTILKLQMSLMNMIG